MATSIKILKGYHALIKDEFPVSITITMLLDGSLKAELKIREIPYATPYKKELASIYILSPEELEEYYENNMLGVLARIMFYSLTNDIRSKLRRVRTTKPIVFSKNVKYKIEEGLKFLAKQLFE